MTEKKQTYEASTMALPPLKTVLGELPEPDPGQEMVPFQRANGPRKIVESRSAVERLIVRIKEDK